MNAWIDIALRATAVMALGLAVWALLGRHRASVRCTALRATFVSLALVPIVGWMLPRWSFVLPWASRPEPIVISMPVGELPTLPASDPAPTPFPWLPLLWAVGTLAVAAPALAGTIALRRIWRRAEALAGDDRLDLLEALRKLGVDSKVEARVGAVSSPMVFGGFRPRLLLPEGFGAWPNPHRDSALLHEAAHIRRFDCAWLGFASVVRAVYACHPLVWWLSGALKDETELAADERAIQAGVEATDYASALVAIARDLQRNRGLVHSQGVTFMNHRQLDRRVRGALSARRRGFSLFGAIALAGGMLASALGISLADPCLPSQEVLFVAQEDAAPLIVVTDESDAAAPVATTVGIAQSQTAKKEHKIAPKAQAKPKQKPATGAAAKPAKAAQPARVAPPATTVWTLPPNLIAPTPITSAPAIAPRQGGAVEIWTPAPAAPAVVSTPAPQGTPILADIPVIASRELWTSPIIADLPVKTFFQVDANGQKRQLSEEEIEEIVKRVLRELEKRGSPVSGNPVGRTPSESLLLSRELVGRAVDEAAKARRISDAQRREFEVQYRVRLAPFMEDKARREVEAARTLLDKTRVEAKVRDKMLMERLPLRTEVKLEPQLREKYLAETLAVRAKVADSAVQRALLAKELAAKTTTLRTLAGGDLEIVIIDEKGKKQTLRVKPEQLKGKTLKIQRDKNGKLKIVDR